MEDNYIIAPVVNGQVYEPVVKVGDTLPIGAIIEYDTTQTIPDGWEYYAENQIKKIAPVTPANGNIENSYGTSQENTYSQEYQNEHNVVVSADTPTTNERVWFKKSNNLFIPTLTNNGTNINVNAATVSLNADEYSFICSGSDMYFGQAKSSGADYNDNCGTLYKVTPGETIKVLVTGTGFNSIFITKYTNSKVSLGYENIASNIASLVIPENCYYVTIRFGVRSATIGKTYKTKVMLAKTTETITYESYHLPAIYVDNEEIYSTPVILWTNPAPTSDFSAQDIILSKSLADFEYYEVLFLMSKYESLCISTGLIPASMGTSLLSLRNSASTGTISRYRDITKTNDTTLAVTTCYQSTGGNVSQDTKTDRVIPYKIIGHKN